MYCSPSHIEPGHNKHPPSSITKTSRIFAFSVFTSRQERPMLPIRSAKLPPNGMLQAVLRSHTSQWRPTPSTRALSTAPLIRHSIRRNNTTRECKRGQRRWNTSQNKPPQPKGQTFVQQPTFWQIMKRALNIRKMFEGQNLKKMFRESPEETVIAVAL